MTDSLSATESLVDALNQVSHCSTIAMNTQRLKGSYHRDNTKLASRNNTRTSYKPLPNTLSVTPAVPREHNFNVHEVTHFFPSPAISCTESLPVVGHISYMTIPETSNEYLESSCKDSSTSKVIQDVHISARLMEEFMELARANTNNDLETCGILGAFLENRIFFITTLIVPKQESSSSSCQAINEEEIYAIQEERSLFTAGWIHTHPSQTCFLSSIDLHTQYSYQVMLPEAVAIVMAPTDPTRSYGIFRLTDPGGMTVLKHCKEKGFHPHRETADGTPIFESCSNVYINPNLRFEIIDLRTSSS